jgi:hypothetical protein
MSKLQSLKLLGHPFESTYERGTSISRTTVTLTAPHASGSGSVGLVEFSRMYASVNASAPVVRDVTSYVAHVSQGWRDQCMEDLLDVCTLLGKNALTQPQLIIHCESTSRVYLAKANFGREIGMKGRSDSETRARYMMEFANSAMVFLPEYDEMHINHLWALNPCDPKICKGICDTLRRARDATPGLLSDTLNQLVAHIMTAECDACGKTVGAVVRADSGEFLCYKCKSRRV